MHTRTPSPTHKMIGPGEFYRVPTYPETVDYLCDALGFRDDSRRPKKLLTQHTLKWRQTYQCPDGRPGRALTNWKSIEDRNELRTMSRAFLETDSHGDQLWPRGGSLPMVPKYPQDETRYSSGSPFSATITEFSRILESLTQLFCLHNIHSSSQGDDNAPKTPKQLTHDAKTSEVNISPCRPLSDSRDVSKAIDEESGMNTEGLVDRPSVVRCQLA